MSAKQFGELVMILERGHFVSSKSLAIDERVIGPRGEQHPGSLQAPRSSGHMERAIAQSIALIQIAFGGDQLAHDTHVVGRSRQHQWRVAGVGPTVRVGAPVEQELSHLTVATLSGEMQRGHPGCVSEIDPRSLSEKLLDVIPLTALHRIPQR